MRKFVLRKSLATTENAKRHRGGGVLGFAICAEFVSISSVANRVD
jgi:hypothetical protein